MSEQTVGRIRKDLGWDQRYGKRCDHGGRECPHIVQQAQPSHPDDATLREFFGALAVCLLVGIAFFLWTAILSVPAVPNV